jgi:hypothetical protein
MAVHEFANVAKAALPHRWGRNGCLIAYINARGKGSSCARQVQHLTCLED